MQALAKEMNFAETVFVLPPQAAGADVRIRIFTPSTELPFAGHPVLGSAFVLGGPLQKIGVAHGFPLRYWPSLRAAATPCGRSRR
jgi:trans-2,3-dihydro-3-hydroxyanthranilate isomerase